MSSRPYYEPKLVSILAPLMYEFIKMLQIKGIHPYHYVTIFKEIDGMHETKELDSPVITRELFLHWKEKFANGNQRTAYEKVMNFRQFSQYICHMGFDSFIPLTPKRPKESYIPYIYSHKEIAMIFNTIDFTVLQTRHMTTCLICIPVIFRFLYYCGARVGETIAIRNEDVNMEQGVVLLKKTKNRQHRLIPLNENMKSILDTYVKYRNRIPIKGIDEPEASFFINHLGKMMSANAVYLHFRRILEKCNITYRGKGQGPRVHDLRHTFAVHSLHHMVKSGLDIYTAWPILSVLLGHHDIYATEHYVRLTLEIYPDLIKETGKNLGDIFPDITNQTNPL